MGVRQELKSNKELEFFVIYKIKVIKNLHKFEKKRF